MKLENFTDHQAWAVEQWEDAGLGDNRRTDRAIAIGAAMAPWVEQLRVDSG